jgi:hypothetical protein
VKERDNLKLLAVDGELYLNEAYIGSVVDELGSG